MDNLIPEILPVIEQHRLGSLELGDGLIYPYYGGLSLANLPASICHWLDAPPLAGQPLLPPVLERFPAGIRRVILLLVDGFGLDRFLEVLDQAPARPSFAVWRELAEEGVLAPLTSITPSTTAAALTTFWTGCPPAQHGVVGYEVWLKEYGLIANMIYHTPASYLGDKGSLRRAGLIPETFLPVPGLGPHLERHGVRSYAFQHASIAQSALSSMLLQGVQVMPFRSLGDLWVSLDHLLAADRGGPSYTYIYWGDMDEHSHRFGPQDERVALEFDTFSARLGDFVRRRRRLAGSQADTLLLVTADHGHIATPPNPDFELRGHPHLLDCLVMPPSGEARLPFVYVRPGWEQRFLRYLEQAWGGQFRALPSDEAIRAGLFGPQPVYDRLPDRVGDFVIIPQDSAYWWFSNRENPLLGRHGGLKREEMLVPLLAAWI